MIPPSLNASPQLSAESGQQPVSASVTGLGFASTNLRDLFSLDLRSLAVFRVGLGLVLLVDLGIRATCLRAHYTDFGILPRSAMPESLSVSLHALSGSAWLQQVLFIVAALFALALLVGYHTRLATVISWALLFSLHVRNPIILQGGDILLRLLLFWGMFLPLGARWSMDSRAHPSATRPPNRVVSAASAALMLQLCFMYWFSAALKTDPSWRSEGTAVYYALSVEQLSTRQGLALLGYPQLLKFLTFATLMIEGLGPFLLFVPRFQGPIRTGVVLFFILFHQLGLGLFLVLGPFSYICTVAWLALLPAWFWDKLAFLLPSRLLPAEPGRVELNRGSSPWPNVLAAFFLGYVFLWNVRTLDDEQYRCFIPVQINPIGCLLGLDQRWGMFMCPLKEDGWYVEEGTLKDGTTVDLATGAPVRWEKPELISAIYPNERWRKYHLNLWLEEFERYRPYYAQYLWRDWDSRHEGDRQLADLKIYFMLKVTLADRQVTPPQPVLFCRQSCPAPESPAAR